MRRLLAVLLLLGSPPPAWSAPPGWSGAGDMSAPRRGHSVVSLATGEALVIGGEAGSGPLAGVERFDPGTNSCSPARSLPEAGTGHAAVCLLDGRVLVVGGSDGDDFPVGTFIYDPARDAWSVGRPLPAQMSVGSATLLRNGKCS